MREILKGAIGGGVFSFIFIFIAALIESSGAGAGKIILAGLAGIVMGFLPGAFLGGIFYPSRDILY